MTYSMPETAEEVAARGRHLPGGRRRLRRPLPRRALAAIAAGRFADEIVPVTVKARKGDTVVDTDEGPRAGTTTEVLAGLRPVVKGGSDRHRRQRLLPQRRRLRHHRGLRSGDPRSYGLTPRARIVDGASAGCAPEIMGIGPVPATQKVLARTGLSVADLGAVELNEAFATQSLACMRRLGLDPEIVNTDGGAIALGHPLGSSGSRIAITLLGRMEREGAAATASPPCASASARARPCCWRRV